jgi:UDP-N-acetylmuramyl pentapeptide phosphotransferase/UDP-N-acetylglucosamine-1-phosphate transferase
MMTVRYEHIHTHISGDDQFDAPQKFHNTNISRVGGIAILIGLLFGGIFRYFLKETGGLEILLLLLVSLPAFIVGLAEDLTKSAGVKIRFFGICISAMLGGFVFDTWINSMGIEIFDRLFLIPFVSIAFTVFAICGLTNAYNIIDGFNGLASIVGVLTLLSLSYIGFQTSDTLIFILGMTLIGGILGFFFWNYPKGKIFLGDGGAYIIGFWIAFISILLVTRNPSVSPLYALLVNAYPVVETLFTIWRRRFHKNKNPSIADDMHLHTLIYRRALKWEESEKGNIVSKSANSRTSPYLWLLSSFSIIAASIFWENSLLLSLSFIAFTFIYISVFLTIIRFKIPNWMR